MAPKKSTKRKFRLAPDEVLVAIAEYARRHKDDRPAGTFRYHVVLASDGSAFVLSGRQPSKKEAEELEAEIMAHDESRREALH